MNCFLIKKFKQKCLILAKNRQIFNLENFDLVNLFKQAIINEFKNYKTTKILNKNKK